MISIEDELFNDIRTALQTQFPGIDVLGRLTLSPSVLPCACIVESDNYVYDRTIDSGSNENHVVSVIETNIYSASASGAKVEANSIFAVIDNILIRSGYRRLFRRPFEDPNNPTLYRLISRYEAVVGKNSTIYRG
jgi:hypothetical protein